MLIINTVILICLQVWTQQEKDSLIRRKYLKSLLSTQEWLIEKFQNPNRTQRTRALIIMRHYVVSRSAANISVFNRDPL